MHKCKCRQGGPCLQAGRRGSLATASVWVTYMVAWTPHGVWVQKQRHPSRTSHSMDGSAHLDKVAGGRSPPSTSELSSDMLPRAFPPWSDSGTGFSAEHFPLAKQCSTCPFVGLQLRTVLLMAAIHKTPPLISGWTRGLHTKELHCATRYLTFKHSLKKDTQTKSYQLSVCLLYG